jgi:hypothetical protein
MKKDQVDLRNGVAWIPDSKTPNGIAEVPLTSLAQEAFRDQMQGQTTVVPDAQSSSSAASFAIEASQSGISGNRNSFFSKASVMNL